MKNLFKRSLIGAALLAAVPAVASAHAFLREAVPAVGSTVHTPPQNLTLVFTECVEPAFTTVTVTSAIGEHFEAARPQWGSDVNAAGRYLLPRLSAGELRPDVA